MGFPILPNTPLLDVKPPPVIGNITTSANLCLYLKILAVPLLSHSYTLYNSSFEKLLKVVTYNLPTWFQNLMCFIPTVTSCTSLNRFQRMINILSLCALAVASFSFLKTVL